jgi:hypothetical protein
MHIAYYDESGDDGNPGSSPLFALTVLYLHYWKWKDNYQAIYDFRKQLRIDFRIPLKQELHAKAFILNKSPYDNLNLSNSSRKVVLGLVCDLIAKLDVRIINVVIVKQKIKSPSYNILDTALTYSIQRIENDLNPTLNPDKKFIIITDSGRVGKMRKTARRIQRLNYIPSKFHPQPYRREIKALIEDPLPKDSKESFFVQMSDIVAFVAYLYSIQETKTGSYHGRLSGILGNIEETVDDWMERLKPSLNLNASGYNKYGVVFHPQ